MDVTDETDRDVTGDQEEVFFDERRVV